MTDEEKKGPIGTGLGSFLDLEEAGDLENKICDELFDLIGPIVDGKPLHLVAAVLARLFGIVIHEKNLGPDEIAQWVESAIAMGAQHQSQASSSIIVPGSVH